MSGKKAKDQKMSQVALFEAVRKLDKEPASELMKVIAEKAPSKKKIERDLIN